MIYAAGEVLEVQRVDRIPDDARLDYCRRLARVRDDVHRLALDAALHYYRTGTPIAALAEALGMSDRTLYRRLTQLEAESNPNG